MQEKFSSSTRCATSTCLNCVHAASQVTRTAPAQCIPVPPDAPVNHQVRCPRSVFRDKQPSSVRFSPNVHIKSRIVTSSLLHVLRPILLSESLDDRFYPFGIGHWRCPEFRSNASCVNPNRGVLQHVSVRLRVGALHGQEVMAACQRRFVARNIPACVR